MKNYSQGENLANKKTLILCASIYHLFLALVITKLNENNCFYLLTTHEKEQYNHFLKISNKLTKNRIKNEVRLRNRIHELLGIESIKTIRQYKRVIKSIGSKEYHLINFSWNFSGPFRTSINWYKYATTVDFIEEGAMCYATPKDKKWKRLIKQLIGINENFYKDSKLKSIKVQNPNLFPKEYSNKIQRLNINELVNQLNNNEKKQILGIFLNDIEKERIQSINEESIIMFTQPLSEDKYISEAEKIILYERIYNELKRLGKVIVKKHPRDNSEYRFEKETIVLPKEYPSELLLLFPIKFKFGVGICTSAVSSCNAEIKLNLNNEFLKDKNTSFINKIKELR